MVLLLSGAATGGTSGQDMTRLPVWAAIVFVSVLLHELGHALMGKRFGLTPRIELHGMGGTTSWTAGRDVGHARGIAISLAGPFAGFILGGLVLLVRRHVPGAEGALGKYAVQQLLWVNIGWGIINLAPMLPLDGGNVMRGFLQIATGGKGERAARYVSIAIAGLLGIYALLTSWLWLGILAAYFAFFNVQALRLAAAIANDDAQVKGVLQAAYQAIDRQDGNGALSLLRALFQRPLSPDTHKEAVRLFAYALLVEGHWGELLPVLESERLTIGQEELARYARTARELGRQDDAARIDALLATLEPRMANDFAVR